MAIEFWQSQRGAKFYDADVPRIAKALERIAAELEKQNEPEPEPVAVPDPKFVSDMTIWVMRFCDLVGEHGATAESRDEAFAKLYDAVKAAKKTE